MADGSNNDDRRVADSLLSEGASLGASLREANRVHEQWVGRVEQQFETLLRRLDAMTVERDELLTRFTATQADLQVMREEQDSLWDQLRKVQHEAAAVVTERDQLAADAGKLSEALDAAQRMAASNDLKAYEAEERYKQAETALEDAGVSHNAALAREAALTDAVAALEKELDALGHERDELKLVRDGLEAQVQQAEESQAELRNELADREASTGGLHDELAGAKQERDELRARVQALQTELDSAKQAGPAPSNLDNRSTDPASPSAPKADDPKRRPARGDGGVVEVVRHRSDVGNRL